MSTYNGRHGPNVSAYLRDLNTISPQDTTAADDDAFDLEDNLALFTNTQFFDFDSGQNTDFQAQPTKPDIDPVPRHGSNAQSGEATPTATNIGALPNLDFMPNDFSFEEFSTAYTGPMPGFPDAAQQGFQALQPSQTTIQIPHQQPQFRQGNARATDSRNAPEVISAPTPAPVPVPVSIATNQPYEEISRVAAEEDKRRRNTAASARFRVKKKQREQALEKSAKEMTEKVTALENRVAELETENKWLKNLLTEKNEGNVDFTNLWKDMTKLANEKAKAAPGITSATAAPPSSPSSIETAKEDSVS